MSFISVIICSYNRAPLLKRALHSLQKQTVNPKHFEIFVVDDGSNDNTAEVCKLMRSELQNMNYISIGKNVGLARSRNLGVEKSSGDYLLFTDDDCVPAKNWVEFMGSVLEREPIASGAVKVPVSKYYTHCHNISQFHAFSPNRKAGYTDFLAGANMAFRRSVLEELNGFQTNLKCSEDIEFILRAHSYGYRAFFDPGAVVTHVPQHMSLLNIFKYSFKHAATTIILRNRYRSILQTPLILQSSPLLLLASPIIALKVTSGIYCKNRTILKYFWTAPMVYALKLAWCCGAASGLYHWNKSDKK